MAAHAWRTSLLKGSVRSGCFSGQRTCSLIPRQVGSAAQVQNTRTRIAQTCLIDATSTLSTVTSPSKFLAIASAKRCYSATSSSGSDDGGQRRTLPVVLNETEVKKRMLTLSGWWTQEGSVKTKDMTSGERVEKAVLQLYARYKFKRYSDGLGLVNAIGSVAERMNHHPTLTLTPSTLMVTIYTHIASLSTGSDINLQERGSGLTWMDFVFAGRVDATLKDVIRSGRIQYTDRPRDS